MQEEIFPLVDEEGNIIGKAPRSICHNGTKLLHPVIHLHIFNSKGELFLQKRSPTKDIQPDKWDTSVAGHIDLGETPFDAALREAKEELAIVNIHPLFIEKHIIETNIERELSYCYYCVYNGDFILNKDELSDGSFWTLDEIKASLNKDLFTLNFEMDFKNILSNGLLENLGKII